MPQHEWALFSRNERAGLTGGLRLSSASGVRRHLGVDTCVVETPYTDDAYARTASGCGIILHRDGRQMFSGIIGSERSMGWDAQASRATIKVQCVGDLIHPADRIAYPDPTRAGHEQTTVDRWTHTGPASTAMWRLLNEQVGPAARPERRQPQVFMGDDPGVGATRTWAALFEPVLDVCARWSALSGANLGLRALWTPDGLRYDVYQPRDVADRIRFSADLTNLGGFTYSETGPTLTYALVAGQGELRNRLRRAATSTNPLDTRWGRRIETYLDRRDEADPGELQTAADDAVTEGAGQVNLTCTLTDSQAATYGRDWDLGDRVTVHVGLPGQVKAAVVVDVVREIAFEVDNTGAERLTPAIGGYDAKAIVPTPTQQTLARIGRTLSDFFARK